ncbi:MAG TPA: acyl-CoA thioesterase [Candidatus Poseidoniaceae archaeon]|nr:MAG TPA: acyl-CoA thioesterase [Candidatus Poseidoniales archaeon]HIH53034.1 acyl-CoA thioesterase [Candidatus Poseidoniaceae archaeon]
MYPYHRVIGLLVRHAFRRPEPIDPLAEYVFRIRPGLGDADLYPEVNNGRHFVLFDLARYQLALKIGLFRWVRRSKSAFVVGGSTIRFRHRLRPFVRAEVRSRLVGMDDRFFYFQQRTVQRGRTCSLALIRTGIRKNGVVAPAEVMAAIGLDIEPFVEAWVSEWNTWDDARPWPEPDP